MSETSIRPPFCVAKEGSRSTLAKVAIDERCLSVLFVGAYLPPSQGSRGVSEDLCAHLSSAGWQMRIVSQRASRAARLAEMLSTVWHERNGYEVAAVDVYSGAAFYWAEAVCWMLRRAGKPYILMLHGGNLPQFASRRTHRVRRLLNSAAAITTPSGYLMQSMRAYAPLIHLQPNGLDISKYTVKKGVLGSPGLIWLRSFHEVYNPVLAVRVLARLKCDLPKIRLTMIGPDKGDGSLQKTRREAERLRVIDQLTLPGAVRKEDVPQALAGGDIFLNTARIDNTPVTVMEAMACGLPVVSTDAGGIPYLVDSGNEGLLVPSDDPISMADAVRRVIVEPDLSRRLAQNARRKAEQLDWSNILPRWEELFTSVIERANPGPSE